MEVAIGIEREGVVHDMVFRENGMQYLRRIWSWWIKKKKMMMMRAKSSMKITSAGKHLNGSMSTIKCWRELKRNEHTSAGSRPETLSNDSKTSPQLDSLNVCTIVAVDCQVALWCLNFHQPVRVTTFGKSHIIVLNMTGWLWTKAGVTSRQRNPVPAQDL
jgi:hypothetical protein